MDQGKAAILAAAIGITGALLGALLSGVLAYRAGRQQVRDQGANEHLHWLRQQRQEHYVQYLQAADACLKALEAHGGALVSLSDRLDTGEIDAGAYDFTSLYLPRDVLSTIEALSKSRDFLLMLGPEYVDERAQAVFSAVLDCASAHSDLVTALVEGPQPDDHPAWSTLADAEDESGVQRREFITAARSVLTGPLK